MNKLYLSSNEVTIVKSDASISTFDRKNLKELDRPSNNPSGTEIPFISILGYFKEADCGIIVVVTEVEKENQLDVPDFVVDSSSKTEPAHGIPKKENAHQNTQTAEFVEDMPVIFQEQSIKAVAEPIQEEPSLEKPSADIQPEVSEESVPEQQLSGEQTETAQQTEQPEKSLINQGFWRLD